MNVIAYDLYPAKDMDINYVSLDELFKQSDIISLHCPLTDQTHHIINSESLSLMKDGVYIINTSRGALIESEALLKAIRDKKVGAAGLDVYEEESEVFYEDFSNSIIDDEILAQLVALPNVIVTSHQAFLTNEALKNIADTTLKNLDQFFAGETLENEICYHCDSGKVEENCSKVQTGYCWISE
jgi:D-lactate dehydrogenase